VWKLATLPRLAPQPLRSCRACHSDFSICNSKILPTTSGYGGIWALRDFSLNRNPNCIILSFYCCLRFCFSPQNSGVPRHHSRVQELRQQGLCKRHLTNSNGFKTKNCSPENWHHKVYFDYTRNNFPKHIFCFNLKKAAKLLEKLWALVN